ncbi:zinc finger protein ZFP2-like isoform X2 [Hyla sarda]|uniref:zinc finger protein ZFP2-like isoform X2 n=1 Tax=Hyla sarda TaxID=327740 RepID=UPI0024C3DC07|nr:zinc finger protein ZFP2-like isoform X2 [Hyla sarda]
MSSEMTGAAQAFDHEVHIRCEERSSEQTLYSGDLEESVREEKSSGSLTKQMLNLTLKIIYLLTGEDYAPLNNGKQVTQSSSPQTRDRSVSTLTHISEPSFLSLMHERRNDEKILELINKILHLLTGEVWKLPERCPQRCEMIQPEWSSDCIENTNTQEELANTESSPHFTTDIEECMIEISPRRRNNLMEKDHTTKFTQTGCTSIDMAEKYSLSEGVRTVYSKATQTECTSTCILDSSTESTTLKKQASSNKVRADTKSHDKKLVVTIVPSYQCSMCSGTFSSDLELLQHQIEHKEQDMECTVCGKQFSCRSHLARHQKIHTGEKMFLCSECGKCFTLKSALMRHQMIHTGERPFACSVCGKSFNQRSHYVRHQLSHSGKKPFSCSECGKRFIQKSDLVKHQRAHKDKSLSCPVCGKQFCSKMFLVKHRNSHSDMNKAVCPDCGKCFTQKSALVVHQRIHTGEKPFSCLDCGKVFNRNSLLMRHQRVHTGEKPFSCIYCGKSFTRTTNLIIHQRTHTGERPFSCTVCHKIFSSNATLIKHQKIHMVDKDVLRLGDMGQK